MFTILGADGKEYGPVTLDQVKAWISDGRANLDTKAKRQGEDVWRRLGDFSDFTGGQAGVPLPPSVGVTPVAAPAGGPAITVDPKAYAEAIIARMKPLDIFGTIERSWNLLKTDFVNTVLATFLVVAVSAVIGIIPILGLLANLFLRGVLFGGLCYFFLKKIRGQKAEISDVFIGFSMALVPLAVSSFLTSLFTGIGVLLLIIPGLYLAVAYQFTFFLIVDKKLDFWPAMEVSRRVITAQWFRYFLFAIVLGILAALGVIALVVGVFITITIAAGAMVFAYEEAVNPKP